ncbi:MAG: hypothetical protein IJH64_11885 [Oscillospiraceae bacterium]|nr:hypothetical protein [Oscillospiraceae bacterium]
MIKTKEEQRRTLEYTVLPQGLYSENASESVQGILELRGLLFINVLDLINEDDPDYVCPYKDTDFDVDAVLFGDCAGIIRVTMPPAENPGEYVRIYIGHDEKLQSIRLYSVAIDEEGDRCFMTWVDDSHYKQHGKIFITETEESKAALDLYVQYLQETTEEKNKPGNESTGTSPVSHDRKETKFQKKIVKSNNKTEWKRLYDENGALIYEGFTKNGKPCGAGASYFSNGNICQEGVFGVKGFLCGREYYPNGTLRFEGVFELNMRYGPNFPRYGFFQTEDGSYSHEGKFRVSRSGVGYPRVEEPEKYVLNPGNRPDILPLMWEDENPEQYLDPNEMSGDQDETMPTFEEFKAAVEKHYLARENTEVSRRYIKTKEAQEHIKNEYASNVREFKEGKITRNIFMKGGVYAVSYCLFLMTDPYAE